MGTFEKRCSVIRNTYERAKQDGDKNIYFIDGKELLMGKDWDNCTVDGTHPNDLGFYRIAEHLEPVFKSALLKN